MMNSIIDAGMDVVFNCRMLEGCTTLTACEYFCSKYSSCDTIAMANDELALYEKAEKTGKT